MSEWIVAQAQELVALTAPKVADLIHGYLADAEERGVRSSQKYTLAPIETALGHFTVPALTRDILDDYRRSGLARKTAGTVRRELGALQAVLNWAVEEGKLKRENLPRIKLPPVVHQERHFLNQEAESEFHRRALAWRLKRIGLYVAIGLDTGARKEAIHDLHWSQVDMDEGFIDFRKQGQRETKKRRVATPMTDRLKAVLETVPQKKRFGPVIGHGDIRSAFETFVQSTPWPWVTSHIMRHTYITLNLRAGVSVFDVAQLVGDTPEIISKYYAQHQADWHLKEAANRRFKTVKSAAADENVSPKIQETEQDTLETTRRLDGQNGTRNFDEGENRRVAAQ